MRLRACDPDEPPGKIVTSREFDIAGALLAFRKAAGMTQAALAAACGIDQGLLSRLERGRLRASLPVARRISAATGVPLGRLIAIEERSAA